MSSLPKQKTKKYTDQEITTFFDEFYSKELSFPTNQVDAVIGFFENRNFDKTAAIAVSTVLLKQAKIDNVNVFKLLDTLKGLEAVQLSAVVTEVLNYSRARTSTLGFKRTESSNKTEKRNIVAWYVKICSRKIHT